MGVLLLLKISLLSSASILLSQLGESSLLLRVRVT
jgi:hypothetical protein